MANVGSVRLPGGGARGSGSLVMAPSSRAYGEYALSWQGWLGLDAGVFELCVGGYSAHCLWELYTFWMVVAPC